MAYETVIGLEVHVQLNTASKLFCGCSTAFGNAPNTQVCPVCLGFPGALPVINEKALRLSMKTALALNCKIAKFTKFDRKHYFYPDLPKNFQISQYDKPLSSDGFLEIEMDGNKKIINIKRIHLEEDAGKLIHSENGGICRGISRGISLVDYNRTGIPLLEIVTQPDLRSPQEAHEFLLKLKIILQYLEVSDCNMEEGSLRCDANISVRQVGQTALGTKTEVKNMNSFKAVRQALEYESNRHKENKTIVQETRLWDSEKQITAPMRTKEEAHDYRYFPEPDLMPVSPNGELLDEIRKSLPEMPKARQDRFVKEYGLSAHDASVLTKEKSIADYFEEAVKKHSKPKIVANWVMCDLAAVLSASNLSIHTIAFKPADLADMLHMIEEGTISGKMAKELLKESVESKKSPGEIVKEKGLSQVTDEKALIEAIQKVLSANPKAVEDFNAGKETAVTFLMGHVMKETKGKANPAVANRLLREKLKGVK